jgi:hypothetical protein
VEERKKIKMEHDPFNSKYPNLPNPYCFCEKCLQARQEYIDVVTDVFHSEELAPFSSIVFMAEIYNIFEPNRYTDWNDYLDLIRVHGLDTIDPFYINQNKDLAEVLIQWKRLNYVLKSYESVLNSKRAYNYISMLSSDNINVVELSHSELQTLYPDGIDIRKYIFDRGTVPCYINHNTGTEIKPHPYCEHICDTYGYHKCQKADDKLSIHVAPHVVFHQIIRGITRK